MNASPYFVIPEKRPSAKVRLFCFPYAGGDIATFLPWLPMLDSDIELVIVQLPGRGKRRHEPPHSHMDLLVDELFGAMFSQLDKPFAFFGHSMGSKIAFELALRLHQNRFPVPTHFFASASAAPGLPRRAAPVHRLPDAALIERLTQLCGVPRAILDHHELMTVLMPTLRADFKLVETYVCQSDVTIPSRLTVLGATDDEVVKVKELMQWAAHFEQLDTIQLFEGGHFYLNKAGNTLTQTINSETLAINNEVQTLTESNSASTFKPVKFVA